MGSKVVIYVGYAAIAWFVWTNFGGAISGILGTVSGIAGGGGYPRTAGAPVAPRNAYYRG